MDPQPLPEPQHVKPSDTSKNLVTGREYGKPNPPWPPKWLTDRTMLAYISFVVESQGTLGITGERSWSFDVASL